MYIENGKISNRQIFRLYVFDLMGIATLLLPPYLAQLCGIHGVYAIALGTGLGFLYLFYLGWIMRKMGTDIVTYLKEQTKAWAKNVVFFIILRHCLFTAGFCAYVFANLMQYSLVKEESIFLILLIIVAIAAYAVSGGLESRARVYEVLFWIILIPFIAMMLASVRGVELVYYEDIFSGESTNLWQGTYLVFLFLTPLFFSLFLIGEKAERYGKSIVKTVAGAILVSGLILLGSYLLLVGNFGENALGTMRFPVVTLMSTIQFEGNFLKRMDALMLAVWFFTLFALLNLHLHYAVRMVDEISKKDNTQETQKNRAWKVILPAVSVFVSACALEVFPELLNWFFDYYSYVAVPLMVIGPGVILLAGRKKKG